jgi:hypothetical protein
MSSEEQPFKWEVATCPISKKPCKTRGDLGDIPYYVYPGDCPDYDACLLTEMEIHPEDFEDHYYDEEGICLED